jgi:hypothetical protein
LNGQPGKEGWHLPGSTGHVSGCSLSVNASATHAQKHSVAINHERFDGEGGLASLRAREMIEENSKPRKEKA